MLIFTLGNQISLPSLYLYTKFKFFSKILTLYDNANICANVLSFLANLNIIVSTY